MDSSVETLNTVRSILDHLTTTSFEAMVRKGMELSVNSRQLIWKIAEITHDQALHHPKYTILYGKWTACLIEGGFYGSGDSGPRYQTYILCKCYDAIQQCVMSTERTPLNSNSSDATCFIANCKFIGELYIQGVYPEKIVWSFINDLTNGSNDLKTYCLCTLVKSTGPKLSKTYNLTKIVEHLLLQTVSRNSREKEVPLALKQMIEDINEKHKTNWLHKTSAVPEDVHPEKSIDTSNTDYVYVDNVNVDNLNVENVNVENVNVENVKVENVNIENVNVKDVNVENVNSDNVNFENVKTDNLNFENVNDDNVKKDNVNVEEASYPDKATERKLSKNFSIKELNNILCVQSKQANCVRKIQFIPENNEAVLPVESAVLQGDRDAAGVSSEELPLPDKMTVSSNLKLADSPCLQSAIGTCTNSVQLVSEDEEAVLIVVSEVLQDDKDADDISTKELSLPDKMTTSSNFNLADSPCLQSAIGTCKNSVQFVPDDDEVVITKVSEVLQDDNEAVDVSTKELPLPDKMTTSSNLKLADSLCLQSAIATCTNSLQLVPEDDGAVLFVVSEVLQDDKDAADLSSEKLPLPEKMTTSSNLKLADSLCLQSAIATCTNSLQLVPEDDEAVLFVVSEVLQDDKDAADLSSEELSLPDKMTTSSNFNLADSPCLQSAIGTCTNSVQFVPDDDEVFISEVSVVLQDDEDATHVSNDKASRLEFFSILPDEQDTENVGGPCCPMDGVPQTRHDRRKSVWKRFKHWSVKRLRSIICCCP